MTDIERLLSDYIQRYEAGEPDPAAVLDRVEGLEREELAALIDGYLIHAAPAEEWDANRIEGSIAERVGARLAEEWAGVSGQLPEALLEARGTAQIRRAELVDRLAAALGVSERREKVALYYHRLERGLLPADGVSAKVFDALAGALGTSVEALRAAVSSGTAEGPPLGTPDPGGGAFARATRPIPAAEEPDAGSDRSRPTSDPQQSAAPPGGNWDEIDELFRGG